MGMRIKVFDRECLHMRKDLITDIAHAALSYVGHDDIKAKGEDDTYGIDRRHS